MAKHIDADAEAKKYLDCQLEKTKTERFPDLLTLLLVVALIGAFALSFWIIPDRDFSEEENRTLAQFPEFSVERLVSGDFTADFAEYMAAQFPLRDKLVGLKAASELAMVKLENNGVMINGDTLAERFDEVNGENVKTNTDAIGAFVNACRDAGINAKFGVVGRAMDIVEFPMYGTDAEDAAWAKLDGIDMIDLRKAMEGHENEYVYYRTDHHYTTLGAYYTYAYLAPEIGIEANAKDHYVIERASDEFYGTTYSKAGTKWIAPDEIDYYRFDGDDDFIVNVEDTGKARKGFYFREYLGQKDKYSSFLGGNYARVDIIGKAADGEKRPKLLLVKDSFGHALAPFLAEHYDIVMIDPRYYRKPLVKLAQDEGIGTVLVICNMDTLSSATPFAVLRMGIK